MNNTDERNMPTDFKGMLPRVYDQRSEFPAGIIIDRRGADRKFADELRAMRERIVREGEASQ